MKKLFCSQYKEADCCKICHDDDSFYKHSYKNFEINHCCSSLVDIIEDIKKHEEPLIEDNCRD